MNTLAIVNDDIYRMIDNSNLADSTKYQYRKAVKNYLNTGNKLTDTQALADYARSIGKSSRAFLKSALKLWTEKVALQAKSESTPDSVNAVTATLHRLEALNEAIQVEQSKGVKAHIWLTQTEVKQLVSNCDDTLKGKRDRVVLSLLLGAGLRREELANLTFDSVKLQGERTVLEVKGKGAKDRVIPISDKLSSILNDWRNIVSDGSVVVSVGSNREVGTSLSAVQIYRIVAKYGKLIGKDLAAHDLRRTYAQLGYEAGVSITQISKLLGHSSVTTTQKYLNLDLNLETTISDFIPL